MIHRLMHIRRALPAALLAPRPSPGSAPARASTPPAPLPQVVYVLSSDGQLHTLGLYSGKDVAKPLRFLSPNAHASDLIVIDNIVYATTTNGCGGVEDGVWTLDLAGDAHMVKTWKSDAGRAAGAPAHGSAARFVCH